ncbi:SMP-30/gluconolactonase/LRE family protein [Rhodobacter sp. KR11]|uniref:SMP-30/gluconolactonase/LRE family protein n=1 Tax=Rhodobacter sp. KR11 TaxID=2974588 RepID=UPI002223B915|nr:SMP-30/gluconolactonase/LRE family protein [Rhodobacter sp. KR11]MCW1918093.1 SMP-30/gluconolactonase/LRE family protein [Rhodobacter sp. KR11]
MRDHQATRLADGFIFLEGPKWHDGKLWVSDVFDHKVYRIAPDGSREVMCQVPHRPSGLGFLPDGTPVVASSKDHRIYRIIGGALVEHADLTGHATGDVNDFAVDAQGRIYVGNFGYDYDAGDPRRTTHIHRVDLDGSVTVAASEVDFPNGMVIIDQGKTLIVAETWESRLTAFDLEDGVLSNRRVFADLGHRQPDGICADAQGAIWTGCFNTGEFLRVTREGITDRVAFDGCGVSCVIADHTLYMTVYCGPVADLVAGQRKAAVFTLPVDVGAI